MNSKKNKIQSRNTIAVSPITKATNIWMSLRMLTGIIPERGSMSLRHAMTEILIFHFCQPPECKDTSPRTNHQTALTTTAEWGSCDEPSSNTECCDKVAHACVTNAMFRHELCTCSRDSRILLSSKRMYFTRRQQRGPLTYHLCERRRIDKSRKRCFSLRHSSGRGACGLFFRTALLRNTLTLRTTQKTVVATLSLAQDISRYTGDRLRFIGALRFHWELLRSTWLDIKLHKYTVPNMY